MTSRDFCFWLQGYFEIADSLSMSPVQIKMIKNHLNLVFKHEIDPSMPDPTGELQAIHDGLQPIHNPPIPTTTDGPNSAINVAPKETILRC